MGATISFGTPVPLNEGDGYLPMVAVTLGRPPTAPVNISAYGTPTRVGVQYTTIPASGGVATVYGRVSQDQVLQPHVEDVNVGLLVESADPCYFSYTANVTVPVVDDERRIWFTAANMNTAAINTKMEADSACVVDNPNQNFPAKAFLAFSDRAIGQVDWVMAPNTNYFALNNGSALVLTTDANAAFSAINVPFSSGSTGCIWTGLNADLTRGDDCAGWLTGDTGLFAGAGVLGTGDTMAWASLTSCASTCHLLCIEQ